jgi:alpha-N-arabinofuranosidase
MHCRFACFLAMALFVSGVSSFAAPPEPASIHATIVISAGSVIGKMNPGVLGGNILGYQKGTAGDSGPDYTNRASGMWDPERREPVAEMVALARNAGMSFARYPGGCGAHLFDWKKTVGPLESRPDQQFGLPEFMRLCADIRATPLITVAEYHGTAGDAADLVEYLNAPNDGKHPWAALRASDGHPAPWGAVWFEYGNESEHGDHKNARMSPEEYAVNYIAYRNAMRRIDPRIKLGAVIATGFPGLSHWASPVLRIAGKQMDFAIHHCYKCGYSGNDGKPDARTLIATALGSADQIQDYYDQLNALIRNITGRRIPIAVTEYNDGFVQERPVQYRHTLGNALANAEMIRIFTHPSNNIVMANFWQFANEYWGAVKGYTYRHEPLVKRPQYYPLDLYHNHFGREIVNVKVICGTYDVAGGLGVAAASGKGVNKETVLRTIQLPQEWQLSPVPGITQRQDESELTVDFTPESDINYYHARKTFPAKPGMGYRLAGMVKTDGLTSDSGACYQIGDARGWNDTKSCAVTPNIAGTNGWTKLSADYVAMGDTREIEVIARRISNDTPIHGEAVFGDVTITEFVPKHFPAVPLLSVNAARTITGKKGRLYAILVNKDQDHAMDVRVSTPDFTPTKAASWTLTGPSVDATNEQSPDNVKVVEKDLGEVRSGFTITLPPHSMTAVEIYGTMK